MEIITPKPGDIVLYYALRKEREQIRIPYRAEVIAVYPKTNVSFARAPAQQYGNSVDLRVYTGVSSSEIVENVSHTEDTSGMASEPVSWAWPS